jgi:pimeloyl-ACP methyl ester carboxylesterase
MNAAKRAIAIAVIAGVAALVALAGPCASGPPPASSFPRIATWAAGGHFMNWRGDAIFYRATPREPGDRRPALLLLHGFPSSSFDWVEVWPALEARFRLLAPDFLGFGLSAKPYNHDYSLMEQADIVQQLLRERGLQAYHILAHDYGDTVAQELLARHAHAREPSGGGLQSVVLLNGGILPDENRPLLMQKILASPLTGPLARQLMSRTLFGRSFSRVFGPQTQPSANELDEQWALLTHNGGIRIPGKLLRYLDERQRHKERWVGAVVDATVPVRLVNGPADPVSGERVAAAYRATVEAADVVLLGEHVGHYPQIEDPQGVVTALFEFHDRLAGGSVR